jgi:hypothetical protein
MSAPSDTIIQLLLAFRAATTGPTFERMCVLIVGSILAPAQRTVTSALRAVGLEQAPDFSNYHEVLNRAQWSAFLMSRILLGLIVGAFVPEGGALRLIADDTLERRRGRKVVYKSIFRDPVLSTEAHPTLSFGIRWVCLCVLVDVPWSRRPWALPFMAVPALSEKRAHQLGKRYRSPSQWAAKMLDRVRRWYPDREVELLADGGYASVEGVHHAQTRRIRLISRLRMDAALYEEPGIRPKNRRGPKPKKGARLPSFAERLRGPEATLQKQAWQTAQIRWYGGQAQQVEYMSAVSLWHRSGQEPARVRWVLLRPAAVQTGAQTDRTNFRPAALLCSDVELAPEQIIERFLLRWNIEVTFEEMRACLGFETQRHWSTKAVGRTTPCLFGLFSIVVLVAKRLHPRELPLNRASWYDKEEPSFRDALAAVRMHLWTTHKYDNSPSLQQMCLIPTTLLHALTRAVCYAS